MTSLAALPAAVDPLHPQHHPPHQQQHLEPARATTAAPAAAAGPRKRRRKTVSGAQNDCFRCITSKTVCDRKRPYCGQCLEAGRECSGYRTTLTWGVGVASRGKLRGKACPVTAKLVDASESAGTPTGLITPPAPPQRRKSSPASKAVHVKQEDRLEPPLPNNTAFHAHFAPSSAPTSHPPPFQPALPPIPAAQEASWQIPAFHEQLPPSQPIDLRPSVLRHHSLQHIHTALGSHHDAMSMGTPGSGSSVASCSFSEADFHSPLEYPQTPGSVTYSEPFAHNAPASYTSQPLGSSVDSYLETLSSSVDSLRSGGSYHDHAMMDGSQPDHNPFMSGNMTHDEMLFSPSWDLALNQHPFDQVEHQASEEEVEFDQKTLAIFDARFSGNFYHVSPRLQSLMEYYDRHVCPYLVAFDGPDNPYRRHILQLAMQNEGLQNAIAALATNNLRMRKKEQPRQRGFVEEITDAFDGSSKSKEWNEPSPEETCYKQMSIDQLNMQLADTRASHDDSVLATLLILCLFHVCDSGFSKFKTQLAGVQKLLSLRHPHGQSDFTGWVEMFFIWFDVMTSAVNDREMQIKGESLDMLDYSANLGALEQFSGCDGRLFKLIARLGRLNLLAQGKAVRSHETGVRMTRPPMSRKSTYQTMRNRRIPRSLSTTDYANLDGNGWGTPILSSDDEESDIFGTDAFSHPLTDDRREFWDEWNDLRARLLAWEMEPAFHTTPLPASTTAPEFEMGQRDLLHINESFRYSALLYTERLGHPVLPSSHANFQKYVTHALSHISALDVTSCVNKFLLWPLFITGTECVDEGHRNIIRSRCVEVQKESGFYNNISGLEVLEKVWREVGRNVQGMEAAEIKARRRDSEAGRTGRYGQAFRWRKAMDRVDGEYILI